MLASRDDMLVVPCCYCFGRTYLYALASSLLVVTVGCCLSSKFFPYRRRFSRLPNASSYLPPSPPSSNNKNDNKVPKRNQNSGGGRIK